MDGNPKQILNEKEVLRMMGSVGAILTGDHFVYTSGLHGSVYINKDAIYPHTRMVSELCNALVSHFVDFDLGIQVVVGPALGGIILSQRMAEHLSARLGKEALAVFAEKTPDGKGFVIKRGYDKLISGKRVLVVEDVLTTGGSVKKVVEVARSYGADVRAVAALCNRGEVTKEMVGNVLFLFSLVNIRIDTYEAVVCPLCRKGVPINTDVGKGREFLEQKSKGYLPGGW